MTFLPKFTIVEQMELLERYILVNSFAYYELNDNIASDFDYDANANQFFGLIKDYPELYFQTRYYKYFTNYEPGCTSGFELIRRIEEDDRELYERLWYDALITLDIKRRNNGR